jgi:hypothetical protein
MSYSSCSVFITDNAAFLTLDVKVSKSVLLYKQKLQEGGVSPYVLGPLSTKFSKVIRHPLPIAAKQ